jgi:hypothetical protein
MQQRNIALRQQLAEYEQGRAGLEHLTGELDRVRTQLATRTAERDAALEPLARLGLKALAASRDGSAYDGDVIQEDAETLGVVVRTEVGPGRYCEGDVECICAECETDYCYRDTPATQAARAALGGGT